MDWAAKVRGVSRPSKFDRYVELLASFNDSPISTYRKFVDDYVTANDQLPAQILAGEPVRIDWKLKITIPDETTNGFKAELARLTASLVEAQEHLRDSVQSLQSLTQRTKDLSKILVEYSRHLVEATPQMAAAATFDERLAVVNRLANDLMPISGRFADCVHAHQKYVSLIEAGIRALFGIYRNDLSDWGDQRIPELMKSIKALAGIALAGIDSSLEFYESLEQSKGLSPNLDKPVQRMQSSILIMAGNRGIFTDWLAEAEELGFND